MLGWLERGKIPGVRQVTRGEGLKTGGDVRREGRGGWLGRLVSSSAAIQDPADRERARLLAGLLLALLVLGLGSGVIQWLLIPGFWPTFRAMLLALAALGGAYAASRTRHFRKAAWAAAIAPIVACTIITRNDPTDAVSGAFMLIGVLFATLFLDSRAALQVACAAFLALLAALAPWQAPFDVRRGVPLLAFQAILSPLLLIAAAHRDRIEELRKEAQRRQQVELQEARQMELLGRLAGGVAHDFNNLLTVVVGNLESLERLGDEHTRPLTEDIRSAVERGVGLTRQLLATARKQLLEPRRVDLNALLRGVERLLRRMVGSRIDLRLELEAGLPAVHADPTQLEQVVFNLALNARDAMPQGGVLSITAARGARAGDASTESHVCLSVSDTGIGMDHETQANLFKPFFTTKGPSGTGLGLATVRGIVEQSRGHIDVTSAPGQGSRFDVYLPVAPAAGSERSVPSPSLPALTRPRGIRVLVVEDEALVFRAMEHMLTGMGHATLWAQSCAQAIEVFQRERGRIDLLLCDVMLMTPGDIVSSELPGLEVAQRLRELEPSLPVLFVSGYPTPAARAARALPCAFLLAKPFAQDELRRKIDQTLGPRAPRAADRDARA